MKFGIMWPSSRLPVVAEGDETLELAKASSEGIKKVVAGMLSKVSVRFALPASDAKVFIPITGSVSDREAGRVNSLVS
jgi:hypothetical protein